MPAWLFGGARQRRRRFYASGDVNIPNSKDVRMLGI
jgi:hypothetical protein